MKTLIFTMTLLIGSHSMAFEKESSFLDLKSAMEASNKETNENTKRLMDEENKRLDQWGHRDVTSITIVPDIAVEERESDSSSDNPQTKTIHKVSMNH